MNVGGGDCADGDVGEQFTVLDFTEARVLAVGPHGGGAAISVADAHIVEVDLVGPRFSAAKNHPMARQTSRRAAALRSGSLERNLAYRNLRWEFPIVAQRPTTRLNRRNGATEEDGKAT